MSSRSAFSAAGLQVDLTDLLISVCCGLALAFTTLFICIALLSDKTASSRDFVTFWAAGQQLVHHASPYDAAGMLRVEQAAGLFGAYPVLFMRNLPWALPMVLPLGLVGPRTGALLWALATVASLVVSVSILRRMYGRPKSQLHWIALSFGPGMICIMMGQSSLFVLLGYVLFLFLHPTRPFMAGLALWLCALKPQLFMPFGVVLIAWIIVSKSYKIMAGAAVALGASCAATWLIDPTAWSDYSHMMRTTGFDKAFIPCLSVAVRLWLSPQSMWLEYLPIALSCAWALFYFWRRRGAWNWESSGGLLLLVSLVAAPYSWVYDGVLAIPALLQGAYLTRSRLLLIILAVSSLLAEVELVCGASVISALFLWMAPAWMAWYLAARSLAKKEQIAQSEIGRPKCLK